MSQKHRLSLDFIITLGSICFFICIALGSAEVEIIAQVAIYFFSLSLMRSIPIRLCLNGVEWMILKNSNKKNQNHWATINKGVIYIHPTLMPHG